jgi:hypothetical protein
LNIDNKTATKGDKAKIKVPETSNIKTVKTEESDKKNKKAKEALEAKSVSNIKDKTREISKRKQSDEKSRSKTHNQTS